MNQNPTDTVVRIMRTYFPGMEYSAEESQDHMITVTLINTDGVEPMDVENSIRSKIPRHTGIRVRIGS